MQLNTPYDRLHSHMYDGNLSFSTKNVQKPKTYKLIYQIRLLDDERNLRQVSCLVKFNCYDLSYFIVCLVK